MILQSNQSTIHKNSFISEQEEPFIKPKRFTKANKEIPNTMLKTSNRFQSLEIESNDSEMYFDENISTNETKSKKRSSTNKNKKGKQKNTKTFIIGVLNAIFGPDISKHMKNRKFVSVKAYSGATTSHIHHHIIPALESKPDEVIIHIGTNNLGSLENPCNEYNRIS